MSKQRSTRQTAGPKDKNDVVEPEEKSGDKTASDSADKAATEQSEANREAAREAEKVAEARKDETADDREDVTVPEAADLGKNEVFRSGEQQEVDSAIESARNVWTAQSGFRLPEYRDVPGDGTVVAPHQLPTAEGLAEVGVKSPEQVAQFVSGVKVGA